MDCEADGVRALSKTALKLTSEEIAKLSKPVDPGAVDNSAKVKAAMTRGRQEIAQKIDPAKAARNKAVEWLKINNSFGPDHRIVSSQADAIDEELAAGRNVQLILGNGLVKSGARTYLCVWNETFFALPLTPAQEKAL